MKRKISRVLFLLVPVSLILGCTQNEIKKEYYDNGRVKRELKYVDGKFTGEQKCYYPNGNIHETYKKRNKVILFKEYHEEGNLVAEGKISDKKRIGEWHYYHENGKLKATGIYGNDGMKDGKWEYFDEKEITKSIYWNVFADTASQFKINIPKSWNLKVDDENDILVAFPKDKEILKDVNFNILQFESTDNLSLEEVSHLNIRETAKAYEELNYKLLKEGKDKINGMEAVWYVFSVNKSSTTHIIMQFYIEMGSNIFQFTFFTLKDYYSEHLPLYKEIVYSFKGL